jgi:hypothetical protein
MRIANRAKVSEIFNMAWIRNSAVAWLQDEKNDHSFAKPSGWARNNLLRGKSLILICETF